MDRFSVKSFSSMYYDEKRKQKYHKKWEPGDKKFGPPNLVGPLDLESIIIS